MTIVNQTLRLSLDEEMLKVLEAYEDEFPGLKPTQIIRTVFLRSKKKKSFQVPSDEEMIKELENIPANPNPMSDKEFSSFWSEVKSDLRKKSN